MNETITVRRDPLPLILRIVAAALILAGGIVHFKLWNDGYRHIDKIGPAFLLNAIGSAAAAVAIVVWRHWLAPIAGLLVVNGTLVAFGLSRTDGGIFDFTERGWNPSPEAALAIAFEIGAAAVLIAVLLLERRAVGHAPAGAAGSAPLSSWAPPPAAALPPGSPLPPPRPPGS